METQVACCIIWVINERINMSSKLITVVEVARKFNVHIDTVRRWVRERRIPCLRPTTRTIRFDLDAVEKALQKPVCRGKTEPKDKR